MGIQDFYPRDMLEYKKKRPLKNIINYLENIFIKKKKTIPPPPPPNHPLIPSELQFHHDTGTTCNQNLMTTLLSHIAHINFDIIKISQSLK